MNSAKKNSNISILFTKDTKLTKASAEACTGGNAKIEITATKQILAKWKKDEWNRNKYIKHTDGQKQNSFL